MMLINHQIKAGLTAIPLAGGQYRAADSATLPHDVDACNDFLGLRRLEQGGEPKHFMPSAGEGGQVTQGHPLGAAGLGIARVAPVKHQEAHCRVGLNVAADSAAFMSAAGEKDKRKIKEPHSAPWENRIQL
jgi:hypothetical protein